VWGWIRRSDGSGVQGGGDPVVGYKRNLKGGEKGGVVVLLFSELKGKLRKSGGEWRAEWVRRMGSG